ncbi:MAG: glycerol-3-phosphate cytidylyltransferase [Ruminococcaceae bacterium]|nr:glycerol-3-phosphate cytidylyltransferase [Oscillospiraceae bacterium]
MVKVITYGTFDLLHYGHIRLLERAKALGDYLIVGVTSDDYDKSRGKINNQQSLMERIAAVRATGLADEIIVEEYDGQKIDDIRRFGADVFTVGSDWTGKFDYLNEYCHVIYLPRTEGVSSTELRTERRKLRLGIVGFTTFLDKFVAECECVNGVDVASRFELSGTEADQKALENFLETVDAVYIVAPPEQHYFIARTALEKGRHVLCESPIATKEDEFGSLLALAEQKGLVLMEGIKTAFSTAYERLILLAKSGKIGQIVSVDATCTSIRKNTPVRARWNSISAWGPTALLPIFQLLGTDYQAMMISTRFLDEAANLDAFTKIDFTYSNAVASIKVAEGAKSEGNLIVSGTEGYIYVPAPWWKTDYFELRYENPKDNKRYFYQLDGEGIRYEIVAFARSINNPGEKSYISEKVSLAITKVMENFDARLHFTRLGDD